jgi:hypothetical protein
MNLLLVQDSDGGMKAFVGSDQGMQQVKAEQLTFGKSSSNWFKISVPQQGEFEILKPGAFAQGEDAIPAIQGIKLSPLSLK